MPVIRGRSSEAKLPDERKTSLLDRLIAEREGKPTPNGPIIFEILLDQPDKLIKQAYKDKADVLALALGVTHKEAIEQGVLPYRARLRFGPQPDFTEEEVRSARLAVGGYVGPEGSVELRFPTRTTAEEAVQQLKAKLPGTEWIVNYADA
jgi:hypothetical protein